MHNIMCANTLQLSILHNVYVAKESTINGAPLLSYRLGGWHVLPVLYVGTCV